MRATISLEEPSDPTDSLAEKGFKPSATSVNLTTLHRVVLTLASSLDRSGGRDASLSSRPDQIKSHTAVVVGSGYGGAIAASMARRRQSLRP
jgi:hypothetical protein